MTSKHHPLCVLCPEEQENPALIEYGQPLYCGHHRARLRMAEEAILAPDTEAGPDPWPLPVITYVHLHTEVPRVTLTNGESLTFTAKPFTITAI